MCVCVRARAWAWVCVCVCVCVCALFSPETLETGALKGLRLLTGPSHSSHQIVGSSAAAETIPNMA